MIKRSTMNTNRTLKIILLNAVLCSTIQMHAMDAFWNYVTPLVAGIAKVTSQVTSWYSSNPHVATTMSKLAGWYTHNSQACHTVATILGTWGLIETKRSFSRIRNGAAKAAKRQADVRAITHTYIAPDGRQILETVGQTLARLDSDFINQAQLQQMLAGYVPAEGTFQYTEKDGSKKTISMNQIMQLLADLKVDLQAESAVNQQVGADLEKVVTREGLEATLAGYVPRATTEDGILATRRELSEALAGLASNAGVSTSGSNEITYTDAQGKMQKSTLEELLKVAYGLAVNASNKADESSKLVNQSIATRRITITQKDGNKRTATLEEFLVDIKDRLRGLEPLLNIVGEGLHDQATGDQITLTQAVLDLLAGIQAGEAPEAVEEDAGDGVAALTSSASASATSLSSAPQSAPVLSKRDILLAQLSAGTTDGSDVLLTPVGAERPAPGSAPVAMGQRRSSADELEVSGNGDVVDFGAAVSLLFPQAPGSAPVAPAALAASGSGSSRSSSRLSSGDEAE